MELQHAFVIKLRPTIRAEIASREFKFPNLQAVIDTAQRYELSHPPVMETWKRSHTHVSSTSPSTKSHIQTRQIPSTVQHNHHAQSVIKKDHLEKDFFFKHQSSTAKLQPPQQSVPYRNRALTLPLSFLSRAPGKLPQPSSPLCNNYNQYPTARCEQPRNQCSQGRKHICSICNLYGCKAIKHVPPPVRSFNTKQHPSVQFTPTPQPTSIATITPAQNHTISQLVRAVSDLSDTVKQLKTQTSTSNLAIPASADNLGPAFGFPAITAIRILFPLISILLTNIFNGLRYFHKASKSLSLLINVALFHLSVKIVLMHYYKLIPLSSSLF